MNYLYKSFTKIIIGILIVSTAAAPMTAPVASADPLTDDISLQEEIDRILQESSDSGSTLLTTGSTNQELEEAINQAVAELGLDSDEEAAIAEALGGVLGSSVLTETLTATIVEEVSVPGATEESLREAISEALGGASITEVLGGSLFDDTIDASIIEAISGGDFTGIVGGGFGGVLDDDLGDIGGIIGSVLTGGSPEDAIVNAVFGSLDPTGGLLTGALTGDDLGSTIGTVLGTAVGGPIGGMIGGALGSSLGGLFGSRPRRALERTQRDNRSLLREIRTSNQEILEIEERMEIWWQEWRADSLAQWYENQILAARITNEMIGFVNEGFGGDPAFVQSLGLYERAVTDYAGEEFIQNLELTLDTPWTDDRSLQSALAELHLRTMSDQAQEFTAGDRVAHEQFLQGDFSQGGWDRFYETISNPAANTPFGAWGVAQERYRAAIETAQEREMRRLDWGQGFRSMEVCQDVGGRTVCQVTTPGQAITGQLDQALGIGLESIIQSDMAGQSFELPALIFDGTLEHNLGRLGERALSHHEDGGLLEITETNVFGSAGPLSPGDVGTEIGDTSDPSSSGGWCEYLASQDADICGDINDAFGALGPILGVEEQIENFLQDEFGDVPEEDIDEFLLQEIINEITDIF